MPELPEVHTISSDLNKHILGYKITQVKVVGTYQTLPANSLFITKASNQTITNVKRVAKNIVITLENNMYIVFHLAMTGQILLKDTVEKMPSWTRVVIFLENEGQKRMLYFTDMRMFGKAMILRQEDLEKLKNKYGPEPLDKITPQQFLSALKKRKTNIKGALLDQSLVSGLGNIYATDALFLAKVHPETPTTKLTLTQADKLLKTSRVVLNEGIKNRGSTLSDKMYVDIFGKEGSHQHHFKIYGKTKCPLCDEDVEFKKVAGRGTYFCPRCQLKDDQTPLL